MSTIEVISDAELKKGDYTDGIVRRRAFESENVIVSQSRVGAGIVSGWHHHGTHHLYGFLVSGHLQIEYPSAGARKAHVKRGDFFHVPPGLVHRDINPDRSQKLVVVNILVGEGPSVVNVEPSR